MHPQTLAERFPESVHLGVAKENILATVVTSGMPGILSGNQRRLWKVPLSQLQ
jgi:hypothetical protein